MKKLTFALSIFLIACASTNSSPAGAISGAWGYLSTLSWGGVASEWVSPDGRMDMASNVSGNSTAVDYWPSTGKLPTTDSLAEITLHRTQFTNTKAMERFNISAMAGGEGEYRFGVERSGSGQFRPMLFCFENVSPGQAFCPFKLTPQGVFVSHDGGTTWSQL